MPRAANGEGRGVGGVDQAMSHDTHMNESCRMGGVDETMSQGRGVHKKAFDAVSADIKIERKVVRQCGI